MLTDKRDGYSTNGPEILLSFVIPTYKGWARLPIILTSINKLISAFPEQHFEIILCCNAQDEPPPNFFTPIANCCVVVRNNPTNIGADANFLTALSYARGRYSWLLGDDDELCDGGGSEVLRLATTGEHSLLVTCYEKRSRSSSVVVKHNIGEHPVIVKKPEEMLRICGTRGAFMSILIYRTEILHLVLALGNCGRFVGTFVVQYHLALEVIRQGALRGMSGLILPCIGVIQYERLNEEFHYINAGYYLALDNLADYRGILGNGSRKHITSCFTYRNIVGAILVEKIHQTHSARIAVVRGLLFRRSIRYWFLIAPLEFLPTFVARFIYRLVLRIKHTR